ncbi:hypothetical protein HDU92_001127 [Lobulomyces angularis]|nr:hypothetical protein HDU92_001127 [Lobulomyces angularis]
MDDYCVNLSNTIHVRTYYGKEYCKQLKNLETIKTQVENINILLLDIMESIDKLQTNLPPELKWSKGK